MTEEENEEDNGRAEDQVVKVEKRQVLCGFNGRQLQLK